MAVHSCMWGAEKMKWFPERADRQLQFFQLLRSSTYTHVDIDQEVRPGLQGLTSGISSLMIAAESLGVVVRDRVRCGRALTFLRTGPMSSGKKISHFCALNSRDEQIHSSVH